MSGCSLRSITSECSFVGGASAGEICLDPGGFDEPGARDDCLRHQHARVDCGGRGPLSERGAGQRGQGPVGGALSPANVAVIIAAHNEAAAIDDAIESAAVLLPRANVFVVSDASTDEPRRSAATPASTSSIRYRTSAIADIEIDASGLIIEDFNMPFRVHARRLGRVAFWPSAAHAYTRPLWKGMAASGHRAVLPASRPRIFTDLGQTEIGHLETVRCRVLRADAY